jgi:small subunit ribosomal protein S9
MTEEKKTTKKSAPRKKTVKAHTPAVVPSVEAPVAKPAVHHAANRRARPVKDDSVKYYGTGRRKEAVARVTLRPGSGVIEVNGHDMKEYFCGRKILEYQVTRPLDVANVRTSYDVFAQAYGGGIPGQAGAVCLGIARALLEISPDFRVKLKREGLLTRDPRMKERKKYGLKRARKAFQYTKR